MAAMAEQEDVLDRKEAFRVPVLSSAILHLAFAVFFAGLVFLTGRHGDLWGNAVPGGAISATLVSSAPALPLPQDRPPSENVLATEKPSPAPAPPQPKAVQKIEEKAIPISTKQQKLKPAPQKSNEKTQAPEKPTPAGKQKPAKQDNRAQYGEGSPSSMARSTPGSVGANGNPVAAAGDFGSRFGYYVADINRRVRQVWYDQEVNPQTQEGKAVVVTFTIARDGSSSNVRIANSSGSSSLDDSARRAVQRVDAFLPLPPPYTGNTLSVAYTFTYTHPNR